MKNKDVIKMINRIINKNGWKYYYDPESNIFLLGFTVGKKANKIRMMIIIDEDSCITLSSLKLDIDSREYIKISEFLHRANYGMNEGNFQFNFDDGEINYKTYINFANNMLSYADINRNVLTGIAMMDLYSDGIIELVNSDKSAKEICNNIERHIEDITT